MGSIRNHDEASPEWMREAMESQRPNFDNCEPFPELAGVIIEESEILDFTKPYTPPPFALRINGSPCCAMGDLHVVTGQSGHGKTQLVALLAAAALAGEYNNLQYDLNEEGGSVLYIDTEESEADSVAFKNRVLTMAKMPISEDSDVFHVVRLREVDKAKEREQKAFKAILQYRPAVAIIDGGLDLVPDFNDQEQCTALTYRLMKLASALNVCLILVLHQNPFTSSKNNEKSEKMAGHIGSVLQRKACDIFQVTRKKDPSGSILYGVSNVKSRGHAPLEDWYFVMREAVGGVWVPVPIIASLDAEIITPDKAEEIKQMLDDNKDAISWPAGKRALDKVLGKRQYVDYAINARLLLEDKSPSDKKTPRYLLNPDCFKTTSQPLIVEVKISPQTAEETSTPPTDPSLPFPPPDGSECPF